MESSLVGLVVSIFDRQLREKLPQFESMGDQEIAPVCRLYGYKTEEVTFFVLLQMHRYEDSFTVELGWSKVHKWPEAFSVSPVAPDQAESKRDARFRLGHLWIDKDVWWDVGPGLVDRLLNRSTSKIEAQVADAVARVRAEGMSYFDQIAECLDLRFPKQT